MMRWNILRSIFLRQMDDEAKKLMEELGTPKEAACDIISNVLDKRIDEEKTS